MLRHGYVRRGGPTALPPPWRLEDVQLHAFFLNGNRASLNELCRRCFNEPSGGVLGYEAPSDVVILTFQHIGQLRSLDAHFGDQGFLSYNEATVWIPIIDRNQASKGLPGTWSFCIPYIFAANPWAVATGREVYGFPKELARVTIPDSNAGQPFAVDALAYNASGAQAQVQERTLLEVRPGKTGPLGLLNGLLGGLDLLVDAVAGDSPEVRFTRSVMTLLTGESRIVLLKQFRAAASRDSACFMAVIEAQVNDTDVKDTAINLSQDWELVVPNVDSHPIASDLGLQVDSRGVVDISAALTLNFDFSLGNARVVWAPE